MPLANDLETNESTTLDRNYKKIGLFDHMGWGNMGDAAIQDAFIINIKKRLPGAVMVVFFNVSR